ncbi:unnamed protein product [Bemisia tabaci]|uniref:Survival of motor neuron-related-splicing factor 30 n=1 Tax=Bemisia tabaci TaxID=7038 RepID=A0A9P0AHS9_BEMTA|nr:PREDICTED: survival of motor neuron-related-splicing factor 30 [Bemisia tabaci]CAH0391877.1 unnamed protein product [Bemisia tabaci]
MAEDLQANLQSYKLQLQQVTAALTTSPDDEELNKLKLDLEEVINLTTELIKAQLLEEVSAKTGQSLSASDVDVEDVEALAAATKSRQDWKPGDKCQALWVEDGQYYEAVIESIEGEEVSVIFDSYGKSAVVTTIEFIKESAKAQESSSSFKKQPVTKIREYQKKKKQKKLQRSKQIEEEREQEKNKWLSFSSKASKKGIMKKSIFASPDNVKGRVGIGTCGVSGKGMTDYVQAEKYKRGT